MESERKGQRKIWGKREIRGEVRGNKEIKRERERREREGERGREREGGRGSSRAECNICKGWGWVGKIREERDNDLTPLLDFTSKAQPKSKCRVDERNSPRITADAEADHYFADESDN